MNSLVLEYETTEGVSSIRTAKQGKDVFFSLEDVVRALASENSKASNQVKKHGLSGLVNATLDALDTDEAIHLPNQSGENRQEVFVTEPGLYRVVLRDSSPAAKKFQRWIIHDVLPAIREHGVYPAPADGVDSDLKLVAQKLVDNTNLLIREIEERERLEREMNDRFSENEQSIREISHRLDEISQPPGTDVKYLTILTAAEQHGLNSEQTKLLWAYAAKICFEEQQPSRMSKNCDQLSHSFPIEVLDQALSNIRRLDCG